MTFEEVAHEEVVVHSVGNNLSNRLGRHLDVGVVF